MTNKNKNVLYVGVTSNLKNRVYEHQSHHYLGSFTAKYNVEFIIYYEYFETIKSAIECEKQLKNWSRTKKEFLINLKIVIGIF